MRNRNQNNGGGVGGNGIGRDFKDKHTGNFNRYSPYDRSQQLQQRDRNWNDDRRTGGRFQRNNQGYPRPMSPPYMPQMENWHHPPPPIDMIAAQIADHLSHLPPVYFQQMQGDTRGGRRQQQNRNFSHYSPPHQNQRGHSDANRELYTSSMEQKTEYMNAPKADIYDRDYENREYTRDNRDYRDINNANRDFRDIIIIIITIIEILEIVNVMLLSKKIVNSIENINMIVNIKILQKKLELINLIEEITSITEAVIIIKTIEEEIIIVGKIYFRNNEKK